MSEKGEHSATPESDAASETPGRRGPSPVQRAVMLLVTAACFGYLYLRLNGAAAREQLTLVEYMSGVLAEVAWGPWLAIMIAYSCVYFAIDSLVTSSALRWFVKPVPFRDILPIRATAYIISIFNEQIGKGAMALYLNRRHGIPGWEVASVMLFIMFCELFYLLTWAAIGYTWSSATLPDVFGLIPVIAGGAAIFLVLWVAYFRGALLPGSAFRERRILHAFRSAKVRHYAGFFLLRSPALLSAVFVYAIAMGFFGVETTFLELLGYLPVIFFAATVPTPMRAAAITSWVVLFPEHEGQIAAFGFLQHNFFIFFNALIGLVFWRRAQRELFD